MIHAVNEYVHHYVLISRNKIESSEKGAFPEDITSEMKLENWVGISHIKDCVWRGDGLVPG